MNRGAVRVPLGLVIVLVVLSFVFGGAVERRMPRGEPLTFSTFWGVFLGRSGASGADWRLFEEVWNVLHEKYVAQPVSDDALILGAAKGLVQGLDDPYSFLLDEEATAEFRQEIDGSFEGVGAEIGIKNAVLVVIAPLPDSPAEQGGLRPRDRILRIDDTLADELAIDEAVSKIRGKAGTTVTLLILSEGSPEPREVTITREKIRIESVRSETRTTPNGKKVAFVRLSSFTERTDEDFSALVTELLLDRPAGIVLDLRNNPGGYLDAAIGVASEFVGRKTVLIEEFSGGRRETYRGTRDARVTGIPIVVLINASSASASEILAGALRDHDIATLIGEKTFGKGSVQDYQVFADGASLKLTIARWLTPQGSSIEEDGISPDTDVPFSEEEYNADRDPQLDAALHRLDAL